MNSFSEREVRIAKIHNLRKMGIDPFVHTCDKKHTIGQLLASDTTHLRSIEDILKGPTISWQTAGRIMLMRSHGRITFGQIQDGTGKIQIMFHRDVCSITRWNKGNLEVLQEVTTDEGATFGAYKIMEKFLDVGDFIQVSGELFFTHKGELTLFVKEYMLLTKAILPMGEKWHGVENIETRLRKRYVDMVMNAETKEMLYRRSRFWQEMRSFLLSEGFIEVETPVLEVTTGGADARPFSTHHNALDIDVYLRISVGELWQKRLMVGGFEKTFEIGRVFRNEGMSTEHSPEYTSMEFYWGYADYKMSSDLVKRMYLHIIDKVYGKRKFTIRGYEVDFDKERKEYDYTETIEAMTGINIWKATEDDIKKKLSELNVKYEPGNYVRLVDALWKRCRKQIAGPAFLVNHPTFMSPLAKSKPENPLLTNRYQVIIAGSEVGNGYSELNDPFDQRRRFEEQQAMRDAGDEEAQMADWDFVEALEYGMPPVSGFGVSERLFCFLENKSIREAQYFPLMK